MSFCSRRSLAVAVLFAASFALPAQDPVATAPTKALPLPGEVFEIAGRTAFVIQPENDDDTSSRRWPWVWYAPTLPRLPADAEKWMFERFLAAGIVIAGIDVGESYGSPAGRELYREFYDELVEQRGYSPRPALLARSRGGLMLYSWAAENPHSVACIAGIYPVCNLASYPGLAKASGAYELSEAELRAQLTEHNPIDRLAPLARAAVPIFHIHGDSDAVVPLADNSAELRRRYEQLGGSMVLETVAGKGHDMWAGWFQSQALVDFVIANVRRAQSEFTLQDTVVRRIFEDSRGTLWLGTNGKGVIRYEGGQLSRFGQADGFAGHAVRAIAEDAAGNVWFGASGGISRYDHEKRTFRTFTDADGLVGRDVWSLTIDRHGTVWVGTLAGVSRFDGEAFTPFELPASEPDPWRGVTSANVVHCIRETRDGRMWFGTNGGAYIWDGKSLANLSEADGLSNRVVNDILEDQDGNMWFATHHAGVCRYDGKRFRRFGANDGVVGTEAWSFHLDRKGNVWFPVENDGVYRFDGESFTRFHDDQGLPCGAVQAIHEDRRGRVWFGGWMALFCFDGGRFIRYAR